MIIYLRREPSLSESSEKDQSPNRLESFCLGASFRLSDFFFSSTRFLSPPRPSKLLIHFIFIYIPIFLKTWCKVFFFFNNMSGKGWNAGDNLLNFKPTFNRRISEESAFCYLKKQQQPTVVHINFTKTSELYVWIHLKKRQFLSTRCSLAVLWTNQCNGQWVSAFTKSHKSCSLQ